MIRPPAGSPLRSLAVPALLGLSLLLGGCAGGSGGSDTPGASVPGPVAEVAGETAEWDRQSHPEHIPRDDYLGPVSAQYDTWAPGSSWRISGDGWDPEADITVSVVRAPSETAAETAAGDPVKLKADEYGQFAGAYALPADTEPGTSYELRAYAESSGRMESTVLTVAPGL